MLKISRLLLLSIAGSLALAATALDSRAQTVDFQRFSPEGEMFSVDMPKNPKAEESEEPYHRMTLITNLYLSATDRGPVFAVASLRGIKVNPQMYTELQRFNSYDDAFRRWFPRKTMGKDAVAKFTLVGDKRLNGNPGREYSVVIGNMSGTAQMYLGRRFYAIVILNSKKDEALSEKFLASLTLPEKVVSQPNAAATAVPAAAPAGKPTKGEDSEESAKPDALPGPNEVKTAEVKSADVRPDGRPEGSVPAKAGTGHAPISGGVLNGKAIYLPQPEYPPIAAQAKVSGTVTVQVLIDEAGSVVSAHAVSGHPLLQASSVAAARQARFSPTTLMGEPVKVSGIITYNFVAASN